MLMQNTVNINYNVINVIDYIHLYNNRHLLFSCCIYCFTVNQSQSHPSNCGSYVDSDLLVIILYGDRDSFPQKICYFQNVAISVQCYKMRLQENCTVINMDIHTI